jgi:putative ABC transport system permease protein
MKYLPLLWANLKRKKVRTLFTMGSILVAFVLFGYLAAIRLAFSMGVDVAGADRLMTTHKISIIMPLPKSYHSRIAQIPGVELVTHANWFGGTYKDPNTNFQAIFQGPVEPEAYLDLYPEFVLPPEQKQAWLADREGAMVGKATAERYGWKLGDRVPIIAPVFYSRKDGSRIWEFNIRGIYDGREKGVDNTQFLFRYDYFDEARAQGEGTVGWYMLRTVDPQNNAAVMRAIDAQFANSPYETKTQTEKELAQSFAEQIGNIGKIITFILAAVFLTMMLVAANTMGQAVRERTSELAVMKTLGFSSGAVMALVLAESLLLAVIGGGLGLALGWFLVSLVDPTGGFLPIFVVRTRDLALGAALIAALGLVAGLLPAVSALRLRIVDALRRV